MAVEVSQRVRRQSCPILVSLRCDHHQVMQGTNRETDRGIHGVWWFLKFMLRESG